MAVTPQPDLFCRAPKLPCRPAVFWLFGLPPPHALIVRICGRNFLILAPATTAGQMPKRALTKARKGQLLASTDPHAHGRSTPRAVPPPRLREGCCPSSWCGRMGKGLPLSGGFHRHHCYLPLRLGQHGVLAVCVIVQRITQWLCEESHNARRVS